MVQGVRHFLLRTLERRQFQSAVGTNALDGKAKEPGGFMRIAAVRSPFNKKGWTVRIVQGYQSFHLNYLGTKTEARWMARMFRVALANHDSQKKP